MWACVSDVLISRISDPYPAGVSDIRQAEHPTAAVFCLITSVYTYCTFCNLWTMRPLQAQAVAGIETQLITLPPKNLQEKLFIRWESPLVCISVNSSPGGEAQEGPPTSQRWQVVYSRGVIYAGSLPRDKSGKNIP